MVVNDEEDALLEAAGHAALDRFIETFNSRDADAWAASLSYPHVRVSPLAGDGASSTTPADYAAAVSYDAPDAMGWHHSAWDTKEILAVSTDKIHASAQWCRYDVDGRRILPNNVSYVITKVDDGWGVQARFGVDSPAPDDAVAASTAALEVWTDLWMALASGTVAGVTPLVRLPFLVVGVAEAAWAATPDDLVAALSGVASGTTVGEVTPLQIGRRGVNLGVSLSDATGGEAHGLFLVLAGEQGSVVACASVVPAALP